jgi:hypothetical protein
MAFEALRSLAASGRADAVDALRGMVLKPNTPTDLLDRAFGSLKTLADQGLQSAFQGLSGLLNATEVTPDLRKRSFAVLQATAEAGNAKAFATLIALCQPIARVTDPNIEALGVLMRVAAKGVTAARIAVRDLILNDATNPVARTAAFIELGKAYVDGTPSQPQSGPQGGAATQAVTVFSVLNELARSSKPAVAREAIDALGSQAATQAGAILSLELIAKSPDASLRRMHARGWRPMPPAARRAWTSTRWPRPRKSAARSHRITAHWRRSTSWPRSRCRAARSARSGRPCRRWSGRPRKAPTLSRCARHAS